MKKARWVSAAAGAAMIAATLAMPAAGVAHASGNGNVTGNYNIPVLSGNTITAPISVPVNLCGVSLGVLGFANSGCQGGASSAVSGVGGNNENGNVTGNYNVPVASGNTITAPISAPVNVCGVSGAVGGFANSDCKGGANSSISGVGGNNHDGNVTGNYNVPVVSGNTVTVPISAPLDVCGVSGAVGGYANSDCKGGSSSCIGSDCNQCHGSDCNQCHGSD